MADDPSEIVTFARETCSLCATARIETTGAARRGGGYHRRCENGHEWDDPRWSYAKAEADAARRRSIDLDACLAPSDRRSLWQRLRDGLRRSSASGVRP